MEFARHVHGYLNDYIRLADAKAAALFVIASGMLGFLLDSARPIDRLDSGETVWFFVAVTMNAFVIVLSVFVTGPRLTRGSTGGLIFWKDILTWQTPTAYAKSIAELVDDRKVAEVATHNWHLADVADRKYKLLGIAFPLTVLGLFAGLSFVIFN